MMIITANGKDHELKTNMRVLEQIQEKAGRSAGDIFANINTASTKEMRTMLCIAAGSENKTIASDLLDDDGWGFYRLGKAVSELMARLTYSGTPDEQEAQINESMGEDEKAKNEVRGLLGLPQKPLPSDPLDGGSISSEPDTE